MNKRSSNSNSRPTSSRRNFRALSDLLQWEKVEEACCAVASLRNV
jgi:hypothetical protein